MQAPTPSQRSVQRRSPHADPGPPPSVPPRSISPTGAPPRISATPSTSSNRSGPNDRTSGGSSGSARRQNSSGANLPLSQIEKSVTHLLVATKQLLETLTAWSRLQATDTQVSDVYVRLGYEFNIACRAFAAINVDTSDLGNVPEELREILESTLSQEASVESLENYLPRIRDIIINLLHGLKRKQQKLRQKQARDQVNGDMLPRTSSATVASVSTGSVPETVSRARESVDVPVRSSSANNASPTRRQYPVRNQSIGSMSTDQTALQTQNVPELPYPTANGMPEPPTVTSAPALNNGNGVTRPEELDSFPPPPPSPPKQQNALAALQRGGDLERRASRRYSAYQISKHLGSAGVPMLPTQNSPIPNRGREMRESINAVHTRGSGLPSRPKSIRQREQLRVAEGSAPNAGRQSPTKEDDSTLQTLEGKANQPKQGVDAPSATLQQPFADDVPIIITNDGTPDSVVLQEKSAARPPASVLPGSLPDRVFTPDESPPPDKDLTLFLQYKSKIKKFMLPGGYGELSLARLQLAFIEKFAWNTHNNGVDLPEIYIQDQVSGVRHELEDLADVKDRSVLVLNVEMLDEVKRHIDDGLGDLRKIVEGIKTAVDDQQVSLQRVSDRQQDAAKEISRLGIVSTQTPRMSLRDAPQLTRGTSTGSVKASKPQVAEIQSLRRDLAVLRQTYSAFQSNIESSMSTIRQKASSVKSVALKATIPDLQGDSGRAYVNAGKQTISEDSDKLVARVDDLQDMVEDLRKDVVTRGVRPLPRQLESVSKEISIATQELTRMQDFLKRERPIWTKIWEKELETVCQDREEITMQEELAADLQDDLEKAAQTFSLVEEATKEQMKDAPPRSRGLQHLAGVGGADPSAAKEGVLGEVRALQPNHQDRLEAIERAEKLRQRELENRKGGEFQKELGTFVEEGRLKKSGGFEEVERARKAKDDRIRREVWERQNGVILEPLPSELSEDAEFQDAEPGDAAADADTDAAAATNAPVDPSP